VNVLLTCVGRRNLFVKKFKNAVGLHGKVLACDSSDAAPALLDADLRFRVPSMDHPAYYDTLIDICAEHRVRLLVSVNDLELGGLSSLVNRFRAVGTVALVSSSEVIATCQDKWAAYRWLQAHDISTPRTYLTCDDAHRALGEGMVQFPLVIKPRWGTSSIGVERVHNEHELRLAHEWGQIQVRRAIFARASQAAPDQCMIVQEWVDGQEHGLDIINDLNGNHVATLARRKLAMRAGNTDRAISVNDPQFDRLGKHMGQRLGHVGPLDCDVILGDRGCQVIDLNPRFGGGYPFSHFAGADVPAALVAWLQHETPRPEWLRTPPGVLVAKCDDLRCVESPGNEQAMAAAKLVSLKAVVDLNGSVT
jgi:carbamoyl-phosphate synthase large subunit